MEVKDFRTAVEKQNTQQSASSGRRHEHARHQRTGAVLHLQRETHDCTRFLSLFFFLSFKYIN